MKRGDMPASPVSKDMADSIGLDRMPDMATGLTVRERMAMAAMQGLLAGGHRQDHTGELNDGGCGMSSTEAAEFAAMDSVQYADALLAELERTGGGEDALYNGTGVADENE